MTPAELLQLFGTDEPVAPALALRAGALAARLRGTRLGPITYQGHEVWHGIDFLFRDADWGTPAPQVDHIEHTGSEQGFQLRVRGRIAAAAEIAFELRIEATERELRYEVVGEVRGDLATNRTGLVLMHPLSACGAEVEVEHTDGRVSRSTFPTQIAPWPPFMLVRSIRHAYAPGAFASCRFAGDDFELEDQRNNADASFKTYSRSNLMPRPYLLRAGSVLRQSIALRIETPPAAPQVRADAPLQVRIGDVAGTLPSIGTSIAAADLHAGPALRSALGELAPAHLHLAVEAGAALDAAALARLLSDAGDCALHLEIRSVQPAEAGARLGALAKALHDAGVTPRAVAVFPSTPPVLDAARAAFPRSRIGGGTPFFFTQLNRIEDLGRCDFLAFGTSAVVHGADDEEIMTGLQSLPAMVDTLRHRHGPLPVHVGPSSIGARASPLGAQPPCDGTRRLALAQRDPRTRGRYGAVWALGYIARFTEADAASVTLFDLAGDAALVTAQGTVPAFDVLRRLGRKARWRRVILSHPEAIAVLALERAGHRETLLANLREVPVEVQVEDGRAGGKIELAPYGIAIM